MAGAQRDLGPGSPAWLAKLSAHLGINPAKTLATFLTQVWGGHGLESVCCREVCAVLMQVRPSLCCACCAWTSLKLLEPWNVMVFPGACQEHSNRCWYHWY